MANPLSMRRYWAWAVFTSLVFSVSGCVNRPPAEHDVLGSLPAQYDATFACADCQGIDYQLTLGDDDRYVLRQHYRTQPPTIELVETGRWHIADNARRLSLVPADTDYTARSSWRIEGRQALTALDERNEPARVLSDYRLERHAAPKAKALSDTRWILTNPPDEISSTNAYIEFDAARSRLLGFTGCNQLVANYERDDRQLKLGQLATTRRACSEHIDTEQSLTAALRQTTSFRVVGSYLLLFGTHEDPAPLAIFQASESPRPSE